jgi:hypothetical protein
MRAAAPQDHMRKREEFAVSLRKDLKRMKLNEKRQKYGNTKVRPNTMINTAEFDSLWFDPSVEPVSYLLKS